MLLLLFELGVENNDYVDCDSFDEDGGSDFCAELTNISGKIYIYTSLHTSQPNPFS